MNTPASISLPVMKRRPAGVVGRACAGLRGLLCGAAALLLPHFAAAQWVTESYPLVPGWNGIWLSHDCSYASLDTLLAAQSSILEVWQWNPLGSTTQFTASPAAPAASDVAWKVWRRGRPADTTLDRLAGNSAYLVRVSESGNALTLQLTGAPLLHQYAFKSSGTNFVGFPMLSPESGSLRNVERFFSFSEVLKANPPVFAYRGGALSAVTPKNPAQITTPRTTALARNKAYWVNGNTYTDYHGPLRVLVLGSRIDFGDSLNLVTVRLKNVVDPARNQTVTATLAPAPSATPPSGQPGIAGAVPLLVRGPRDPNTLQYTYAPLTAPITRAILPGEEIEVILSVDRAAMGGAPGAVFQSLLQVSDSLSLTRTDLGVRAVSTSFTGLWVGAAIVNQVDQIIGQSSTPGQAAPSNFPLRLLLHRGLAGATTMIQQGYSYEVGGTPQVATKEAVARAAASGVISRLSSAHFPLDLVQAGSGQLAPTGSLTFQVALGHNALSNPFVHTYHPDHDNLDARFEQTLPAGVEAPNITRAITLTFTPTIPGMTDPTVGSTTLGGTYAETITGLRAEPITVSGVFVLRRVSAAQTLLTN